MRTITAIASIIAAIASGIAAIYTYRLNLSRRHQHKWLRELADKQRQTLWGDYEQRS